MRYKVIFDTNSIRNAESVADFFGGRTELERFLKVSEIIIPDIVIEEIKSQKRKHLISKRDSFLSNPFHFLRKVNEEETKSFDIDKWITDLVDEERIPHTVIFLTKDEVLDDIKKLCLENLPPFEENCDKGFKDAYIYFTVLEYLESTDDENIFVVTNDDRLRMAFEGNTRVTVVKNFNDFEKYIDAYFRDEYFVNRLKEEISENITAEHISGIWLNAEGNWIIKLTCDGNTYFTEADFNSREIITFTDEDFESSIAGLILSESFSTTHNNIAALSHLIKYFSNENIKDLIEASTSNSQIYQISTDEDVKQFFMEIYESKSQILPEETKLKFEKYFNYIP